MLLLSGKVKLLHNFKGLWLNYPNLMIKPLPFCSCTYNDTFPTSIMSCDLLIIIKSIIDKLDRPWLGEGYILLLCLTRRETGRFIQLIGTITHEVERRSVLF